jgi:hypothetical protein
MLQMDFAFCCDAYPEILTVSPFQKKKMWFPSFNAHVCMKLSRSQHLSHRVGPLSLVYRNESVFQKDHCVPSISRSGSMYIVIPCSCISCGLRYRLRLGLCRRLCGWCKTRDEGGACSLAFGRLVIFSLCSYVYSNQRYLGLFCV